MFTFPDLSIYLYTAWISCLHVSHHRWLYMFKKCAEINFTEKKRKWTTEEMKMIQVLESSLPAVRQNAAVWLLTSALSWTTTKLPSVPCMINIVKLWKCSKNLHCMEDQWPLQSVIISKDWKKKRKDFFIYFDKGFISCASIHPYRTLPSWASVKTAWASSQLVSHAQLGSDQIGNWSNAGRRVVMVFQNWAHAGQLWPWCNFLLQQETEVSNRAPNEDLSSGYRVRMFRFPLKLIPRKAFLRHTWDASPWEVTRWVWFPWLEVYRIGLLKS